MPPYDHFYQQIASGAAVCPRFSLIPDSDALAVINTGGNGYLNFLFVRNVSRSVTIRAFLFDDLARSMTIRTGLDASGRSEENLLCKYYLPLDRKSVV